MDDLAKWIFIPSLVVIVVLLVATKFETPGFVNARRNKRDTARARRILADPSPNVVVYWDRCRSLSRSQIVALGKEHGKRYVNYEIREAGWALNFTSG